MAKWHQEDASCVPRLYHIVLLLPSILVHCSFVLTKREETEEFIMSFKTHITHTMIYHSL